MATTQASPPLDATDFKPIHSLVLDTGPLIMNDPPASILIAKAEQLYILPIIMSEIRDPVTRFRVETTLLPFVKLRSPRPESLKFVTGFARRTGDLGVLSKPDLQVLALGYELECERNGGDWRLRSVPGQKRVNGRPPQAQNAVRTEATPEPEGDIASSPERAETPATEPLDSTLQKLDLHADDEPPTPDTISEMATTHDALVTETTDVDAFITKDKEETLEQVQSDRPTLLPGEKADETTAAEDEASDDSDSGWITPSNLKKHQAKDTGLATPTQPLQKTLQAAVLTSDFAMQNVALRMNLNLLAPSLTRITHLKNWVLRCHGCFTITRDMEKQFCPSCGQPTLTRTSCSTDDQGNFKVHLKRNFQWNNRGNVYSVPKPAHGTAHGRVLKNAAGKNGWGSNLVLAEDQKEFVRAGEEQRRARKKDLMDDDYMPDIYSGARSGPTGKLRVGAGRNVNSKRKH